MKQRRARETRRLKTATSTPPRSSAPASPPSSAIPFPPGLTSLALFSTPRRRKDPLADAGQSKRRSARQRASGECRFAALMATNLVIAAGSSALATALDTMPQWGPYLSAWLASLSSTSLRPGLFLFALGGGYLGLNSLNDPPVISATSYSYSPWTISAPVSPLKLSADGLDYESVGVRDALSSGAMGLGGAATNFHGFVNFNFVVAMAALLSASGLCCAALLTHGLGGRMRYRHLAWMFWQPFVGGLRFVLIQAMAWTLFSLSLLIFSSVAVVAAFVGHTTLGYGLLASAGATGLASEFLLMASLLAFESPSSRAAAAAAAAAAKPAAAAAAAAAAAGRDVDECSGSAVSSTAATTALLPPTPAPPAPPALAPACASLPAAAAAAAVAPSVTEMACTGGGSVQGTVAGVAWRAVAVRPPHWTERELFVATRGPREVAGAAMMRVKDALVGRGGGGGLGEGRELLGKAGGEAESDREDAGVRHGGGGSDSGSSVTASTDTSFNMSRSSSSSGSSSSTGSSSSGSSSISGGVCDSAISSSGGTTQQPLSVREMVWWAAVRARSTVMVSGLYCWQYYVIAALLTPLLLRALLPAHHCSTAHQQHQINNTNSSLTHCSGDSYGFSAFCYGEVVCALRAASAAVLTAMAWVFAYCAICPGGYERSGRGERKWIQNIVMPLLEEAAAAYFHGISIVKEGAFGPMEGAGESREQQGGIKEQKVEEQGESGGSGTESAEGQGSEVTAATSSRPLIFTYHPHGLMPAVMAWFPLSSAFRALFPAIRPIPLVASVCFRIPLARTYCLWGGLREVSREGFLTALKDTGAAVLCPGGQSELTYHATNQSSSIVLCARKIGFVRIALQTNALLVPTICFGEPHSFDNLFHWPTLQRFTYRRFGFPIPFWPVGLFGFLPLPRACPITLVVGRPFDPRSLIPTNNEEPSYEDLCTIRDYYYGEVKALFDRHKAIHGFSHLTLELRK
ncbi:hypothetical protein CLOM_g9396 [Closterium sp. NIES-68]|nr:hypothetical protein CLOM_g9396 [Closterium sp. NIES-68]